jgi:hypothetical protein
MGESPSHPPDGSYTLKVYGKDGSESGPAVTGPFHFPEPVPDITYPLAGSVVHETAPLFQWQEYKGFTCEGPAPVPAASQWVNVSTPDEATWLPTQYVPVNATSVAYSGPPLEAGHDYTVHLWESGPCVHVASTPGVQYGGRYREAVRRDSSFTMYSPNPVIQSMYVDRGPVRDWDGALTYFEEVGVSVTDLDGIEDIASVIVTDPGGQEHPAELRSQNGPNKADFWWPAWGQEAAPAPGKYTVTVTDREGNSDSASGVTTAELNAEDLPEMLTPDPAWPVIYDTPVFTWSAPAGAGCFCMGVREVGDPPGSVWDPPGPVTSPLAYGGPELVPGHSYDWYLNYHVPDGQQSDRRVSCTLRPTANGRFIVYSRDPVINSVRICRGHLVDVTGADSYEENVGAIVTETDGLIDPDGGRHLSVTISDPGGLDLLAPGGCVSGPYDTGYTADQGWGQRTTTPLVEGQFTVTAQDTAGHTTIFTTASEPAPPESVPTITDPENGATIGETVPTFVWNAIPGVERFEVWVEDVWTGARIWQKGDVPGDATSVAYGGDIPLVPGRAYRLQVRPWFGDQDPSDQVSAETFAGRMIEFHIAAPPGPVLPVLDFETQYDLSRTWGVEGVAISLSPEHGTSGTSSMQITFPPSDAGTAWLFTCLPVQDWSGSNTLLMDFYNPNPTPLPIAIQLRDGQCGVDDNGFSWSKVVLQPGANTVPIYLRELPRTDYTAYLNLSHIYGLFIDCQITLTEATSIYWDNLRLTNTDPSPMVADFETNGDLAKWEPFGCVPGTGAPRAATLSLSADHATSGASSLRIDVLDATAYAGLQMANLPGPDWSAYSVLYADFFNPGDVPVTVEILLADSVHGPERGGGSRTQRLLPPGSSRIWVILSDLRLPDGTEPVDLRHMNFLQVTLPGCDGPARTLYLDNLHLESVPVIEYIWIGRGRDTSPEGTVSYHQRMIARVSDMHGDITSVVITDSQGNPHDAYFYSDLGDWRWEVYGEENPSPPGAYALTVTDSHGYSATLSVQTSEIPDITAVIATPPANYSVASSTPVFSWSGPADVCYCMGVYEVDGPCAVWCGGRYIAGTETSVLYNDNGGATQPELTPGHLYGWWATPAIPDPAEQSDPRCLSEFNPIAEGRFWVANTQPGSNVSVKIGDVTVTFGRVTAAGLTTAVVASAGAPPSGFIWIGDAYHIATTATVQGAVTVAIHYDRSLVPGGKTGSLVMLHLVNGTWVNVTNQIDPKKSVVSGACPLPKGGPPTDLSLFAVAFKVK